MKKYRNTMFNIRLTIIKQEIQGQIESQDIVKSIH
jgi:hypothetical protein